MPLALQAKLLRVLQEGEIAASARRRAAVDVRVLSATHRGSQGPRRVGALPRGPLLPAPRLRPGRASAPGAARGRLPLAQMFAARLGLDELRFSREARAAFERYPWPGNVRELGNVVEHAAAFAAGGVVEVADLPDDLQAPGAAGVTDRAKPSCRSPRWNGSTSRACSLPCGQNFGEASKVLGISRTTLWRKVSTAP